jgi:hypothetical protein
LTQLADSDSAKTKNIIDMALGFTAMMRIFSEGSKSKIEQKLEHLFRNLVNINTRDDYDAYHRGFCVWFTREIQTAGKKMKNRGFRPGQPASYGQGAKVLDIAIKVYVYYCSQPNAEIARRVEPLLNGAVDTPIMKHLKCKYATSRIRAKTIQEIGEDAYRILQSLVLKESLSMSIYPVQYDDIVWRRLNR